MANLDLELFEMDVKTEFFNGELDKEIYIKNPIGFTVKENEHRMCRLSRSLYGVKQFSRHWNLN